MPSPMLTTVDNPYNPFVQFDEWYAYDHQRGYNTLEYLARMAPTSIELSDEENDMILNDAITEIIYYNVLGIYQKVTAETFDEIKSRPLTKEQKESLALLGITVEEES